MGEEWCGRPAPARYEDPFLDLPGFECEGPVPAQIELGDLEPGAETWLDEEREWTEEGAWE